MGRPMAGSPAGSARQNGFGDRGNGQPSGDGGDSRDDRGAGDRDRPGTADRDPRGAGAPTQPSTPPRPPRQVQFDDDLDVPDFLK